MKEDILNNIIFMKKVAFICLFCLVLMPCGAIAQTTLDFINDLQQGTLTPETAASTIADTTGFDITQATEFATNLQNMVSAETAGKLLENVLNGSITETLASELSEHINLGDITDIPSIESLLSMPNIAEELQGLLEGQAMEAVTELMGELTELIGGAEALAEMATQFGAEALAGLLEDIAPELVEALGGVEAIADALNEAAGGDGVTPSAPAAASGDDSSHSCCQCQKPITINHIKIRNHMTAEFMEYRIWFVSDMFKENILPAWQLMTTQLTTVGMMQVSAVGQFFDSKHQLETQRLFQTLTAQAHKDYHPSEGLCSFGTNIRSLSSSERKSDLAHRALAAHTMQRQLSSGDSIAISGVVSDKESRIKNFIDNYCDPTDNGDAFSRFCQGTSSTKERQNKDINFTQTVENKLTLDLDFSDTTATDDEQDIIALSSNLFAHDVLPLVADRILANGSNQPRQAAQNYLDLRSIAAKRSVAQNSFHAITALKANGEIGSRPYLYRLMQDLGIKEQELEDVLGEKPSYFAQMEVLTKNIYQNPEFYSDLYDKPANVERKGAALQAIALMQDRDTFDSLMRSEASLATLLETLLQREHRRVSGLLRSLDSDGDDFDTSGAVTP